ncbi:hypothetical protein VTN49DRAFT_1530 [Thermomyces lanuginosus]|uniref:uncharacterized protein n=1 Tax=Thermomyces lanuginosus TaxID=5541 RepID=UPI0037424458
MDFSFALLTSDIKSDSNETTPRLASHSSYSPPVTEHDGTVGTAGRSALQKIHDMELSDITASPDRSVL